MTSTPWETHKGSPCWATRGYARRSLHPWPRSVPLPSLRPHDGTGSYAPGPGVHVLLYMDNAMRDALDTPSLALRMALPSHRGVADNDHAGEGALRGPD